MRNTQPTNTKQISLLNHSITKNFTAMQKSKTFFLNLFCLHFARMKSHPYWKFPPICKLFVSPNPPILKKLLICKSLTHPQEHKTTRPIILCTFSACKTILSNLLQEMHLKPNTGWEGKPTNPSFATQTDTHLLGLHQNELKAFKKPSSASLGINFIGKDSQWIYKASLISPIIPLCTLINVEASPKNAFKLGRKARLTSPIILSNTHCMPHTS